MEHQTLKHSASMKSIQDPKVRKNSQPQDRSRVQEYVSIVEDRLVQKMQKMEILADLYEEDLERKCPFAPALCNKSRVMCSRMRIRPIHERYRNFEISIF